MDLWLLYALNYLMLGTIRLLPLCWSKFIPSAFFFFFTLQSFLHKFLPPEICVVALSGATESFDNSLTCFGSLAV